MQRFVELGAEIDCDLYWECPQRIVEARCVNCEVDVPSDIGRLRHFMGGELYAAECQAKFAVYGCSRTDAERWLEVDAAERWTALDRNVAACYIQELRCVQFSTGVLPASGAFASIPGILPETWAAAFAAELPEYLGGVPLARKREFMLTLIERGDHQGSSGLHFDTAFLQQIVELRASLVVRLRYLPEPAFEPSGICRHCDIKAL